MRLSSLTESKDNDGFDYSSISKEMWSKEFTKATKEFNVTFVTENDEARDSRDIDAENKQHDEKCTIRCELRYAGGDWQTASIYFRCQLVDGYVESIPSNKFFVVIPNGDQGNDNLVINKHNMWEPIDYDGPKSKEKKPNEDKCWEFLNEYLEDLVNRDDQDA